MQIKRNVVRWQINQLAKIKFEGEAEFIDCKIIDISSKGAQIVLDKKLHRNTGIKLSLLLSEEFILDIEAWIVWHRAIGAYNLYGLYFGNMKDSDKENIYKFVYKYCTPQITKQWWEESEKGGEKMEDRRVFARFPVELPLKYLDLNKNREGAASTIDVSAKGIGLVVDKELAARTPLEMWLKVPDKGEPLYTRGQVVWSKNLEPDKYQAGIELERAELMGVSWILRSM